MLKDTSRLQEAICITNLCEYLCFNPAQIWAGPGFCWAFSCFSAHKNVIRKKILAFIQKVGKRSLINTFILQSVSNLKMQREQCDV